LDVAILGAGPIGATTAHRLAQRGRVRSIVLIDESADAAAGKALDIRQSGPVERFDADIQTSTNVLAAVGASVIVVADQIERGAWREEAGRAVLAQLGRAGARAPLVFAAPSHINLIETAYRELSVPAARLLGTAASAMLGAARALAAMELNLCGVDLGVVGRPPELTVAWSSATVQGTLVTERVPPHRLLAVSQNLRRLWPPGPYAVGSATAAAVEALLHGSRRQEYGMTVIDGELGVRGRAVLLPVQLGRLRVIAHALPSLSPQERTELLNTIAQ
jgi:malate dehydrogenase